MPFLCKSALRCVGGFALCVLAGCDPGGAALTPVAGTVTLDDKPFAGALVKFLPQGTTPGHGGSGKTDANGNYVIVAHRSNERKGLQPGEYKVMVTRLLMPDGSPLPPGIARIDSPARDSVPEPYCKPHLTPLAVTIAGAPVTFDVPLKKNKE